MTQTGMHLVTVPPSTSTLHLTGGNTCLLKTAIGNISANGYCVEANILFDESSQRSFLAKSLADRLNLYPHSTETVALSTFGNQGARTMKVSVTTVQLITLSGQKIPLSVSIVPTIVAPLQCMTPNLKELPHLHGLCLALPITTGDCFEITLLIGADYYWDVVEDHVIRGNRPTAMQSKLGYLLSGPITIPTGMNDTATSVLHVATQYTPENTLEKFWNVETLGITQQDNSPNQAFMEQLLFHLSQYATDTSKDMLKNLYVDNIMTGCDSEEATVAYYSMARAIMSDANFNLRSLASNSHNLMEQAKKDGTAAEPGPINALGLQWDTANDTISLTMKNLILTHHTLVTK